MDIQNEIMNIASEMNRGFLQLIILTFLDIQSYGYDIIDSLEKIGYKVEENTLYPLLRRLEKKEILVSEWRVVDNKPRKYYSISQYGKELRKEIMKIWIIQNQILQKLDDGRKENE